jgi:hypothetical protein
VLAVRRSAARSGAHRAGIAAADHRRARARHGGRRDRGNLEPLATKSLLDGSASMALGNFLPALGLAPLLVSSSTSCGGTG